MDNDLILNEIKKISDQNKKIVYLIREINNKITDNNIETQNTIISNFKKYNDKYYKIDMMDLEN